jgi:hypothetical protein
MFTPNFFVLKQNIILCDPRVRNVFPKWPARSFELATPGLHNGIQIM